MRLTKVLLGYLNRVFDRDPGQFLAFRLNYDGAGMTWAIQDGILITRVAGGTGENLTVDLSQYTILQLVLFLHAQPGYSVPYADGTELQDLSAEVLLDGSGDTSASNGDHICGYTSLLWAYMEALAVELDLAEQQINAMPAQMSFPTANGFWLDYGAGTIYGVPRLSSESDPQYARRALATVLAPRGNNIAIEMAIESVTGQDCQVVDFPLSGPGFPLYNSIISYDGTYQYKSSAGRFYGLFDVVAGYDLLGSGSPVEFLDQVRSMLEGFRDAGTHLHAVSLAGSKLLDSLPEAPLDAIDRLAITATLADVLPLPIETATIRSGLALVEAFIDPPREADAVSIAYSTRHDGLRRYDGKVPFNSGGTVVEAY
jgi:hypothetical protein